MFKKILSVIIGTMSFIEGTIRWWKASRKEGYEKTVDKIIVKRDVNTARRIVRNIAKNRKKRRDRS